MMIATVMEFTGAVTVGARVSDTIRTKIVGVDAFVDQPAVLALVSFPYETLILPNIN